MKSIKERFAKALAKRVVSKLHKESVQAIEYQKRTLLHLSKTASNTQFGKQHSFKGVKSHHDFLQATQVLPYNAFEPYIQKILNGEEDVLWPGKPIYFAKTSGTTSGSKYIPITKQSINPHINAARNALLSYIYHTGDTSFVNGKMIFLQGSPELTLEGGIPTGRLSGIVAHHVPKYLQKNRMPSWETNCIDDWEKKLDKIVEETLKQPMTLISGIPPWVKMYFEKLLEQSGKKTINEVFPRFSLFVYGGVSFAPYKSTFDELIGKKIGSIELFPASEGFFAYQDVPEQEGMLLNTNAGMYFEFIPQEEWGKENPERLPLEDVEVGKKYGFVVSSNAGLWAYDTGDVVKFTSLSPFRIMVSGRTKHFTSAFGEHVIGEEVEKAMKDATLKTGAQVTEFTVAPMVEVPEGEKPFHEWFVEFENPPQSLQAFILELEKSMCNQNTYYKDLIHGNVLESLHVTVMKKNAFVDYMKSKGKLGGQNKVPRLSNDRKIADELTPLSEKEASL